jgi:cyclomaltodextrinase
MAQPNVPAWVNDAIFYQIFPDRFATSARVAKPRNLEPWNSPPTTHGFKGGDLLGIAEHLDYMQDLGITAIYLTPIFQSTANHRYHTHDYYHVDPLLGDNAAFAEMLAAAHRRGMRVLLDGVFNHASRGNYYFNDILENGPLSPWIDWFTVQDWPLHAYDQDGPPNYDCWWGLRPLPRWNIAHPPVRDYMMRVAEHWIRAGIDGWRLDVPLEITAPGFWQEFRQRVRALNPEAYIVAEIWDDASPVLHGDQFDAAMNYPFTEAAIQFAGGAHIQEEQVTGLGYHPYPAINAAAYADKIDALLARNAWATTLGQFNLLDSHDTARLRTIFGGDEASVRLATLLLYTFPGTPSIFYGDEIGLVGGKEPACRVSFPWDRPETWNTTAQLAHRQYIALRRQHPALRTGTYARLAPLPGATPDDAYAFARQSPEETIIVAVNASTSIARVPIPLHDPLPANTVPQMLVGDARQIARQGDHLEVTLPPRDGCVIGLA